MSGTKKSVSGGHANAKMQKYPRVSDYMQNHYPAQYKLYEDASMQGSLVPRRGFGITVLIPDAALTKKIAALLVSADPEAATDYLSALILTDYFPTAKELQENKDNIPNALQRRLMIKGAAAGKVTIEDGELTVDESFKAFSRIGNSQRSKMAVWKLKGDIKVDTPKASERSPQKKGASAASPATGGYRGGSDDDASTQVAAIRTRLLREKVETVARGAKSSEDGKSLCPLMDAVTSVLYHWQTTAESSDASRDCYHKVRSIMAHDTVIDFLLVFANPDVFPYDQVLYAYTEGMKVSKPADYLLKYCSVDVPEKDDPALILRKSGLKRLQDSRERVLAGPAGNGTTASAVLKKLYAEADRNSLGGESPAYPASMAKVWAAHPGLHILLDEAVHWLTTKLAECRSDPDPQVSAKRLTEVLVDWNLIYGDLSYLPAKTHLLGTNFYAELDPKGHFHECMVQYIKGFALRLPYCTGVITGGDDDDEEDNHDPTVAQPYSSSADNAKQLEVSMTNQDAVLSEECIRQLRAYMAAHGGKLPPNL
jgi:hypothetical protein